jgi:hypothetical protein
MHDDYEPGCEFARESGFITFMLFHIWLCLFTTKLYGLGHNYKMGQRMSY